MEVRCCLLTALVPAVLIAHDPEGGGAHAVPDVDHPLPGLPRVPALGHAAHVAQHGGQVVVAHLLIVSIVSRA